MKIVLNPNSPILNDYYPLYDLCGLDNSLIIPIVYLRQLNYPIRIVLWLHCLRFGFWDLGIHIKNWVCASHMFRNYPPQTEAPLQSE